MSLTDNLTPLKPINNTTNNKVSGVTYFKLKSDYDGDYTKYCGILGEEMDNNFYFLRGNDIDNIDINENGELIITRVDKNYQPIVVKIKEEQTFPTFEFDKVNGIITIKYPDGTISTLDGFLVDVNIINISTDCTLEGDGTILNPLRLSSLELTGSFAPVENVIDLTNGNVLDRGKYYGYRVITKENIDNFGYLYPFSSIEEIQNDLKESNSQWRVPSKEDWDELLNAFECEEYRTHNNESNGEFGDVAGRALKSHNLWDEYVPIENEPYTFGEDIVGMSIYPLGTMSSIDSILKNIEVDDIGQIAGMWTNTAKNDSDAFAKIFTFNSGKVNQVTPVYEAKMSIRLVKDYTSNNYKEFESILGSYYPTIKINGIHEDFPYTKIWTKINFYSNPEKYNGVRSIEWDKNIINTSGYFINEWNGIEWRKKILKNGDSVVISSYENKSFHEWRVIDGELIDTVEILVEGFDEEVINLNKITRELVTFCGDTTNRINELSSNTQSSINGINNQLENLKQFNNETNNTLSSINNQINEIKIDIDNVNGLVIENNDLLTIKINDTIDVINSFSSDTITEIEKINNDIKEENQRALTAEQEIIDTLNTEIEKINNILEEKNEYIISLENRIGVLEDEFSVLENTIKSTIKDYLKGVTNEISVTETDDNLIIGFDENAIFGNIINN